MKRAVDGVFRIGYPRTAFANTHTALKRAHTAIWMLTMINGGSPGLREYSLSSPSKVLQWFHRVLSLNVVADFPAKYGH